MHQHGEGGTGPPDVAGPARVVGSLPHSLGNVVQRLVPEHHRQCLNGGTRVEREGDGESARHVLLPDFYPGKRGNRFLRVFPVLRERVPVGFRVVVEDLRRGSRLLAYPHEILTVVDEVRRIGSAAPAPRGILRKPPWYVPHQRRGLHFGVAGERVVHFDELVRVFLRRKPAIEPCRDFVHGGERFHFVDLIHERLQHVVAAVDVGVVVFLVNEEHVDVVVGEVPAVFLQQAGVVVVLKAWYSVVPDVVGIGGEGGGADRGAEVGGIHDIPRGPLEAPE